MKTRQARRRQIGIWLIIATALIAVGISGHQIWQGIDLVRDLRTAIAEHRDAIYEQHNAAKLSESRRLADLSSSATQEGNASLGLVLALSALPSLHNKDRPWSNDAESSLRAAMAAVRETAIFPKLARAKAAQFTPDGKYAIVREFTSVAILDVKKNEISAEIETSICGCRTDRIVISPNSDLMIVIGSRGGFLGPGTISVYEIPTGKLKFNLLSEKDGATNISIHSAVWFDRDGSSIWAALPNATTLERWNAKSGEKEVLGSIDSPADTNRVLGIGLIKTFGAVNQSGQHILIGKALATFSEAMSKVDGEVSLQEVISPNLDVNPHSPAGVAQKFLGKEKLLENLFLWSVAENRVTRTFAVPFDPQSIEFTANPDIALVSTRGDYGRKFALVNIGAKLQSGFANGVKVIGDIEAMHRRTTISYSTLSGNRLAVVHNQNSVRLIDLNDEESVIESVSVDSLPIQSMTLSPDGAFLAEAKADGSIHLLSAKTGATINILKGGTSPATTIQFNHSSDQLLSIDRVAVRLWNLAPPESFADFKLTSETHPGMFADGFPRRFARLNFYGSPLPRTTLATGGRLIAELGQDEDVILSDWKDPSSKQVLSSSKVVVEYGGFNRGQTLYAGFTGDNRVLVWNTKSGALLLDKPTPFSNPSQFEFSASQTRIFVVGTIQNGDSYTFTVRAWDIESGQKFLEDFGGLPPIPRISTNKDGSKFAVTDSDRDVVVFNGETGELNAVVGINPSTGLLSKDERIYSTHSDSNPDVKAFNAERGPMIQSGEYGNPTHLSLSEDGRRIAILAENGLVSIWDTENQNFLSSIKAFDGLKEYILTGGFKLSTDGSRIFISKYRRLASGDEPEKFVAMYGSETGRLEGKFQGASGVSAFFIDPGGEKLSILSTGASSWTIREWILPNFDRQSLVAAARAKLPTIVGGFNFMSDIDYSLPGTIEAANRKYAIPEIPSNIKLGLSVPEPLSPLDFGNRPVSPPLPPRRSPPAN